MFPHTVTIYNKYREDKAEKWQRTVLPAVFWNEQSAAVMRRAGLSGADKVQLLIPQINRAYLPPREWQSSSRKGGHFTLQEGDTVVLGACRQDIERSVSELQGGMQITSVDSKSFGSGMDLWEVSAK